jgi:hypothetical protein
MNHDEYEMLCNANIVERSGLPVDYMTDGERHTALLLIARGFLSAHVTANNVNTLVRITDAGQQARINEGLRRRNRP